MHENLLWTDIEGIATSSTKEIVGQLYVKNVIIPLLGSEIVGQLADASLYPGNSWRQSKIIFSVNDLLGELMLQKLTPSVILHILYLIIRYSLTFVKVASGYLSILFPFFFFISGIVNAAPCISVEIKPKCGSLPNSRFITEVNTVKRTISRFQMHQVLKLHQGEISCVSDYDPLDLFSGSIGKINKAIKELFTLPQNNFRIFLNGSLISGGLTGTIGSTKSVAGGEFEDTLEGVLGQLLDAQKLDFIDIEGAIRAYYNVISQHCKVCGEWGDSKVSKRCSSLHSLSLEDSLKIARDYMIAATAKDCSLMLSFRPKMDEDQMSLHNTVYLESINQRFDYKAYFIDLDMKPLKKMVHYYELDHKIVSCPKGKDEI
ncbi:hypothetical protein GIB67_036414 [Kingdonia uniflora]|uniref:Inositol-pentakisphosphate 2-kinase n=1 Tax=Kingdonia uniflora TaxID=39325 RepID=A0A7J7L451_9MAGN|nr:hypothetical protein GIB67_036414 [Kingdonia uniflora]